MTNGISDVTGSNYTRYNCNLRVNSGISDNIVLYQNGNISNSGSFTSNGGLSCGTVNTSVHNIYGSVMNINCLSINLNGIVSSPTSFFTQF